MTPEDNNIVENTLPAEHEPVESMQPAQENQSLEEDQPSSPIPQQEQLPNYTQQPQMTAPIEGTQKKQVGVAKYGIIAAVILALLGAGFGVYRFMESEREKQEAEAARIAAIEAHNDYVNKLESIRLIILTGAATTEEAVNLMLDVWHSAIFYDDIDEWSADTREYYSDDFNTSLALLFASDTWYEYESQIEDCRDQVDGLMRKLNNPPEDCERAYDTLQTLYGQFNSFIGFALSPSGSYQSISSSFAELDTDILSTYQLLGTQIPEELPIE